MDIRKNTNVRDIIKQTVEMEMEGARCETRRWKIRIISRKPCIDKEVEEKHQEDAATSLRE